MRIDADSESPFYFALNFKNPEIYLDGKVVDHVVSADDEAGYVRVIDYDDGGRPRYAGGQYIIKTLTGDVRIEESKA